MVRIFPSDFASETSERSFGAPRESRDVFGPQGILSLSYFLTLSAGGSGRWPRQISTLISWAQFLKSWMSLWKQRGVCRATWLGFLSEKSTPVISQETLGHQHRGPIVFKCLKSFQISSQKISLFRCVSQFINLHLLSKGTKMIPITCKLNERGVIGQSSTMQS